MTNTAFPDLGCKQRTKAVPPVPHGLMADVDSALEQKIFDLSQRQGVADIQHHRAADYLRGAIEITEGILHRRRLRDLTSRLKPIYSDNALLQVSVSGFYAWRNRGPSQRQLDDMVLLAHVRAAFRRSRESYGAERVHHELADNGIEVGRHRVARLMRGNGLSPKRKQKFKKTTDSQHNKAVASNLLDQNFSTEAPNEKWAADISYIWTAQGWLYLAVMLDLYSRRVIGWAVGARMTSDLPLRALNRAIGLRQPGAGVIHHSDRGSQYCSDAYQARLGELGFLASMSGKGNCYDNAVVETFFKTIKSELIWRTVFMSRSQAETAIAGYIDGFYNPVRRHSTLDFTSPVKFEAEAMQTV